MHLAIQLIGTPQFQLDYVPVTSSRRAVVALLAYLTASDIDHPNQRYSRESLASLLWTDYDQGKALANLRHTLWEVAQFIGENWVIAEHETIYLNPQANLTLDLAQFQSLLQQAAQESRPELRIPSLVGACQLYRGDFLSGFSLREGASFNEWLLIKSESLRHDIASALNMLIDAYGILNQIPLAIPYAQRLVALDPIQEAAQRRLMQLYAQTDQQSAALQQYRALEKLLRKELNLDPQPETRDLYKKIRKGEFKQSSREKEPVQPEKGIPKHNIPVHLTTFVGREKEEQEISALVLQGRLVTLLGAGGIGKTRLSQQVGQSLLNRHPDGIWFIPLESLTDEDLVPQSVAAVLHLSELPKQTIVESLVNILRDKSLLLIFDNCEHLLEASAQLAETLLKNCPAIKILATSREALRVEGEILYHVPPLVLPKVHNIESLDELATYESLRLFLERARLVAADFQFTRENIDSIAQICSRLDGIPLAIELAAAHADIFTPEEILKQLNRSFNLLISNARSVFPRHQTMRTSIDWGWNLLTDFERIFIRQLSVFIGGWTLQAVQAIGLSNGPPLISALVKKSFVIVQQRTEYETRYGFHEVIRSYAQEKLRESGEEENLRARHLDYFVELARQLGHGVDQQQWLERLFAERDNIRAALEWAALRNVQAGLYISHRLRTFWENCELREEARWILMI